MNVGNMSINKNSHCLLNPLNTVYNTVLETLYVKTLLTSKCEENSSPYPYPLFKNAPHVLDERTVRIVDAVYIQPKRCR